MRLWELNMDGKVAIVTGGGQGLGKAIALGLAHCGASVCIADVNLAAAEEVASQARALGPRSLALQVDATVNEQAVRMAKQTVDAFGRIDILVNNAGGATGPTFGIGRVLNISERDWDDTLTRNVKSVFLCTKAVVPTMLAQKSGSIVNMASITGQFPFAGMPAYSAAKAAVINLTKSMAMEFAPHVRVNALAPGLIETPRTSLNRRPEQLTRLLTNVPLARMGTAEEVADMAVYLASDVAAYISGTILDCNGGQVWMTEDGRPNFRDADRKPPKT
ncbi:MAG: SDR family oxidoreductase [Betaproteobacteria bacterium]|nr:SDR family oxidoreductase [Betaproteobacteria bacterium]